MANPQLDICNDDANPATVEALRITKYKKLARVTKELKKRAEDDAKKVTRREVRGKTEKAEKLLREIEEERERQRQEQDDMPQTRLVGASVLASVDMAIITSQRQDSKVVAAETGMINELDTLLRLSGEESGRVRDHDIGSRLRGAERQKGSPAIVDVGWRPTASGGTLLRATAPIDITSRHHHTLSTHHPLHERSSAAHPTSHPWRPAFRRQRGAVGRGRAKSGGRKPVNCSQGASVRTWSLGAANLSSIVPPSAGLVFEALSKAKFEEDDAYLVERGAFRHGRPLAGRGLVSFPQSCVERRVGFVQKDRLVFGDHLH
ncbi:hypothetical protein B0T13DRAFT_445417 [Neurospora crassa]|nr:hypothetical protein B0T13DRAFT_445417 [Neurospora crassa]